VVAARTIAASAVVAAARTVVASAVVAFVVGPAAAEARSCNNSVGVAAWWEVLFALLCFALICFVSLLCCFIATTEIGQRGREQNDPVDDYYQ